MKPLQADLHTMLEAWVARPTFNYMFKQISEFDFQQAMRPVLDLMTMNEHFKQQPTLATANALALDHARMNGVRAFMPVLEPIHERHYARMAVVPVKTDHNPCDDVEWLSLPPKESYPAYATYDTPSGLSCCGKHAPQNLGDGWNNQYLPLQIPGLHKIAGGDADNTLDCLEDVYIPAEEYYDPEK